MLARVVALLVVLAILLAVAALIFLVTLPDVGDAELRVAQVLRIHHGVDTEMPPAARVGRAIVAVEDEHFYSDHGVGVLGLLRAGLVDLTTGPLRQGGSTITQQLGKALYMTDDHMLGAKLRKMGLALKLEMRHSKAQILETYLNAIYYGDGQWGITQASRAYAGVSPQALDWAQASLLAGLPQAPSAYDPTRHFALAHARQRQVLEALVRGGAVSPAAAATAYSAAAAPAIGR